MLFYRRSSPGLADEKGNEVRRDLLDRADDQAGHEVSGMILAEEQKPISTHLVYQYLPRLGAMQVGVEAIRRAA